MSSDPDVKVSYYTKPDQVLLVAATNKRVKPSATVTIDLVGLGLDPDNISEAYRSGPFTVTPDPDNMLRLGFPEHNSLPFLSNDNGFASYVWLRSDQ